MSEPIQQLDMFLGWVDVCPTCLGIGLVSGVKCKRCKGTGKPPASYLHPVPTISRDDGEGEGE